MQQMASKNWGQNATNPIGFRFCNLKKGNQVSQVGTNFLVPAPTFWSHCQQIIFKEILDRIHQNPLGFYFVILRRLIKSVRLAPISWFQH